jgi:hypothetical protein
VTVRTKKPDLKEKLTVPGGIIITDTKPNKANFFDSFVASINTWFTDLNKKLTQKKTPTYTVTDVERRKGVVQKATSKTGTIFTADRETLKEEIRRRNQVTAAASHERDISWSPRTEPGFALLQTPVIAQKAEPIPAPKPERVFVEFKKKSLPEPAITLPSSPEPVIVPERPPFVEALPVVEPRTGYEAFEGAQAKQPIVPAAEILPPAEPSPTIEVAEVVVPEEQPVEPSNSRALSNRQGVLGRLLNVIQFNTNALTFSIAGSVITILVLVFIARAIVTVLIPNSLSSQTPVAIALLASTTVTDLSLPSPSQKDLLEKLKTIETISGIPQEVRLTDSKGAPLSPATTLQLLGFAGSKNLQQNVSDVHIITINAQRAIVLKVTDPTAAFGSILRWEPTIATDLQVFMSLTNPPSQAVFSDKTINGVDVRILSIDGSEKLVYGFISATVILITEDTASFTNIIGGDR